MKSKIICFFLAFLILNSCQTILIKVISKKDISKDVKYLYNAEKQQSIVFFPMIHIGKKGYFESAKTIIDSLRKEGYQFYYESIHYKDSIDEKTMDVYDRKLRKLIGFSTKLSDNNKSLPSYYKLKNYEFQNYNKMGILNTDTQLDLDIKEIIDSFENRYYKIELNQCDWDTDLNAKYKCGKNKNYIWTVSHKFRDPYISEQVLKNDYPKIALIYGKAHWYGLLPGFWKNGFELVEESSQ